MVNARRTDPERREVYLKDRDPDRQKMALPEGKSCGDCYAFQHCQAMYAHIAADEVCDFFPNRFADRKKLEAERAKS